MAWRKGKGEKLSRGKRSSNPLLAALVITIIVLLIMMTYRGVGVDIGMGSEYNLGQGVADYGDEDVVFNFECIAPTSIEFDDLQVEIVLLSEGMVVSVATSNESVSAEDLVIPKLRVFENVTIPHNGAPMEGLGFILTLTYKGRLGAQYVTYSIPWDD
jgi:hypothetical protein